MYIVTLGPHTGPYRETVELVKALEEQAFKTASIALLGVIPENAVLIPAPLPESEARLPHALCAVLKAYSHMPLCDCLKIRKNGKIVKTQALPHGKRACLIDITLSDDTKQVKRITDCMSLLGEDAVLCTLTYQGEPRKFRNITDDIRTDKISKRLRAQYKLQEL